MASIEEVRADFRSYQASWRDLRPFLVQYLPRDTVRLHKADRHFSEAERHLERGTQAEKRRQKLRAWWWYILALAAMRDHGKLMDELGERGLQAQEEARRPGRASA